jgi:hypothetical protein
VEIVVAGVQFSTGDVDRHLVMFNAAERLNVGEAFEVARRIIGACDKIREANAIDDEQGGALK